MNVKDKHKYEQVQEEKSHEKAFHRRKNIRPIKWKKIKKTETTTKEVTFYVHSISKFFSDLK